MDNCKIIEDLLPSYCDGLTGEESSALIRTHVESCPECARLLEKMSAEPPREVLDHREQFHRKLKEYEQKHRTKTLYILLACVIVLSLVLLAWTNSYSLSKWVANMKMGTSSSEIVFADETESYYIYHASDGYKLVTLAKNDILNLWYIVQSDDSPEQSHAWFGESNYRSFGGTELTIDFDFHYLYTGTNAKALIQLDTADIPAGVLVEVNQNGPNYWIHAVSYDTDALNQLNLMQLLRDKGFIE